MGKSKKSKAEKDSSSSSSEDSSESSEASQSSGDRKISGNKSESTSDSELDIKDQFLLPAFKAKPVKVVVSSWAKRKLRSPFLGTPLGKDERVQLTDDYYCSAEDHRLFAAPRVADSPLALITTPNSTALNDLTKIHSDLLFAMRIGLIDYEKVLSLASAWAAELSMDHGRTIAAGPWNGLCYRYRLNFPKPVPSKIRDTIPEEEVEIWRDFIEPADGDRTEKLNIAVRYALSYKKAFDTLFDLAGVAHENACRLDDALSQVRSDVSSLAKDTGSSMRVLGGVCQQIKAMREAEYTKPLDQNFKKFLTQRKASQTPAEKVEARAGGLVDDELTKVAKDYGKRMKVMEGITQEKQKRDKSRKAKKAAATKTDGASGSRPKKRSNPEKSKSGAGAKKKPKKSVSKKKTDSKDKKDKEKDKDE